MGDVIKGINVVLRPITDADTPLIVKWRNDPFVQQNFLWRQTLTEEIHRQWLRESVDAGLAVQFIIECAHTLSPLGSVYLRDIDYESKTAEFGVFIGEKEGRGRGLGTECARLILAYAFEKLQLNSVFLRVFSDNAAAVNSYKRAGFIPVSPPAGAPSSDEPLLFMRAYKPVTPLSEQF